MSRPNRSQRFFMMIEFRKLSAKDRRDTFECGVPELDLFFRKYAKQNQYRHFLGVTYVAVLEGAIQGFATVSPCHIEGERLSDDAHGNLPAYPLPMLRLARLAVATSAQGLGVGKLLLRGVFGLALEMRSTLGCVGVVTDAKPNAVGFYTRYGFKAYSGVVEGQATGPPPQTPMFLSIKTIAKAARG